MRRGIAAVALGVLVAVALVTTGSWADAVDSPPQTIAGLKKQVRNLRSDKADLRDQVEAQDLVIADLNDQLARLRTRLANQPDPLDAVVARDPDGLWAAIAAISRAFPNQPEGQLCGYDKSSASSESATLSLTSFSFFRWSGC